MVVFFSFSWASWCQHINRTFKLHKDTTAITLYKSHLTHLLNMTDNRKHEECLLHCQTCHLGQTVSARVLSVQQWAETHQVALETDEVDPHGDCAVGVAAKSLDPVHQVGTELVASFQHTQHSDVMVPQVVHDVSGQTFGSVDNAKSENFSKETLRSCLAGLELTAVGDARLSANTPSRS